MPLMRCVRNGRPGWKFGKNGYCYIGTTAKAKAKAQQKAMFASGYRGDADDEAARKIAQRREKMGFAGHRFRRPPVWLYPFSVESAYRRALFQIVANIVQETRQVVIPHLQSLVDERDADIARADAWPEEADQIIQTLKININNKDPYPGPEKLVHDIGEKTASWNDKQWRKILRKTVGVDLLQREPWMQNLLGSFTRQNVALIKSIKDKAVTDIEGKVQRGLAQGLRHERIAKDIRKQFKTTRNRAKLIARDQVSKLNGQITEARQTNIGIEEYIWRTSQDERVRPTHAAKEGKKFRWDNPPADTGHPGQDIQCRCTAEPVMDDLQEEVAAQTAKIPSAVTVKGVRKLVKKKPLPAPPPPPVYSSYDNWVKNIPKADKKTIFEWEENLFAANDLRAFKAKKFGEMLDLSKDEAAVMWKELSKVYKEAPKYMGEVLRGMRMSKAEITKIANSEFYKLPSFVSSSKDLGVAQRYATSRLDLSAAVPEMVDYNGPKAILRIRTRKGMDISDVGALPDQQEVILGPGSKYRVMDVIENRKGVVDGKKFTYTEIFLEEVG